MGLTVGMQGSSGSGSDSSSLSVTDGSTTVADATSLTFSGATVTDGGSNEAQVAISGGGSSGLVLIPAYSGPITSPVSIANFPLPTTGYAPKFRLELINVVPSTNGVISAALYFSGVPLNDLVNYDSYQAAYFEQTGDNAGFLNVGYSDSLLDLSGTVPSLENAEGVGCSLFIDITVGSDDFFSQLIVNEVAWNTSGHEIVAMHQTICVNPVAVSPPSPARCDKIAVVCYGNGDIPPSGNDTFTCQWAGLYGQPI